MIKYIKAYLGLMTFTLALSGCSTFFDKDNTPTPTPLSAFTPETQPVLLWSQHAGNGTNSEYLKMNPVLTTNAIVATSVNGTVSSFNKETGKLNWSLNTKLSLTTGAGAGDGIVAVASRKGYVLAIEQATGTELWRKELPGEILASPAVSKGIVVVKTIDGYVRALSAKDGHEVWVFQQVEPNLILRGASAPVIRDNQVLAGFANGNLTKLGLQDGQLSWTQTIAIPEGAFAIQRMTDIDATPLVYQHKIYVATYQGKIASLEWVSGRVLWSHDISSYTGMSADANSVYITDAKSLVWGFNADSGLVDWRQTKLEARNLSGPASINNYVVIGDSEGYLHWLNKQDGHFAARMKLDSGIYATPVAENNVLYVLTNSGYLAAYRVN